MVVQKTDRQTDRKIDPAGTARCLFAGQCCTRLFGQARCQRRATSGCWSWPGHWINPCVVSDTDGLYSQLDCQSWIADYPGLSQAEERPT